MSLDPLYLFACAVLWHRQADAGAGWELVRGLKSSEPSARIATALLAETRYVQLPARGLGRAKSDRETPAPESGLSKLRKDKWFCGLSPDVLKSFSDSSHLSTYPGGAVLFVEGQSPRGGLVLCSGKVKLSTTSRDGKVLILKMAVPAKPWA